MSNAKLKHRFERQPVVEKQTAAVASISRVYMPRIAVVIIRHRNSIAKLYVKVNFTPNILHPVKLQYFFSTTAIQYISVLSATILFGVTPLKKSSFTNYDYFLQGSSKTFMAHTTTYIALWAALCLPTPLCGL